MFKDALRWFTVGGVIAIPIIIPFIVSAMMFFPYITGKNFTFRIIIELVFAAWLLLAALDARYRPRFSWVLSALVFFTAVVGLADLFGANPFKSFWSNFERMEGYLAILHLLAYFVVASTVLASEKLWNVFWYCSLGASMAVAGIGLAPIVAAFPDIASIPRIDARFGNPIYLAVYSLFHIFIAFMLMLRVKSVGYLRWVLAVGVAAFLGAVEVALIAKPDAALSGAGVFILTALVVLVAIAALDIRFKARWVPWLLGFAAVIHIATMVLTLTRGTVLGFLGGAVVTALLIALFERERKVLRWVASGALVLVLAIAAAGYAIKDTEFAKTTPVVNRFTQMSLSSGTVEARFMNWGMAWEGAKDRPILGWGQGNYEYVFSKYHDPNMWGEEPWFDRTHNIVFDWLVAAGFAGVIAYFLIPISLFTHLWVIDPHERRWSWRSLASFSAIKRLVKHRDETFTATERALWTGLITAYLFHNFFVFDNIVSYILFFSVLAYLHWRVTQDHEPLWNTVEVRRETVASVMFPVTLVATIVIVWYVNIIGIQTSKALIQALIPQRQLPNGQVVANSPEDILETYKRALNYDQLGRQEVREQLAQMAANMQRAEGVQPGTKQEFMTLAVDEMKRELERNPESARLWLFLGSLYANVGRVPEAEETFAIAVEKTPTKQAALFQLGEIKLVQGKFDESLELFKRAYELAPEYEEARKLYAFLLIRTGKDKEAVNLLTEYYGTAAVDDPRLFMEWTNAERYDIVVQILEARVEKNPEDIQQQVSLAAAYHKLGRTEEAITLLEGIQEVYPEYAGQMQDFIKEIRGW